MKCKLITCDLDGTLLDSHGNLSKENYDAIVELEKRGILFVPNTGRSFFESPPAIREHPSIKHFISSNGAVVQNIKNEIMHQSLLSGDVVQKINKMSRICKLMCTNHKNNSTFSIKELLNDDAMKEYNISEYFKKQIYTCMTPIDNYYDVFDAYEPCEMIAGCFRSEALKTQFFDVVNDIPNLRITATGNCIEIVNANAGKENGVKHLINILGLKPYEIITVGDGQNDINMMKMTSNSIAVSNASYEVKKAAGKIGCSNDEHIIRYILENII